MNEKQLPPLFPGERIDEVNEQITLIQREDGLTFGTDAYLLAAFLRPMRRAKAVELGAGTGIVSLLIAARDKVGSVVAVEFQPEYAELCERNVALNGFDTRIRTLNQDVRDLNPRELGFEADVVLSNPPYMKTDAGSPNQSAAKNIARHETAGGIADFCLTAGRLLKHGGVFYTVYRPDRLSELMAGLHAAGLEPKRMTFVHADTKTVPSMVLTESRKGGAAGLTVTPPLILYRDSDKSGARQMTDEALAVYDTCSLFYEANPQRRAKTAKTPSDHKE